MRKKNRTMERDKEGKKGDEKGREERQTAIGNISLRIYKMLEKWLSH